MIKTKRTFTLQPIMASVFLLILLAACGPGAASDVAITANFTGLVTSPTYLPTRTTTSSPTETVTPSMARVKQLARWGEGPINQTAWSPDGRIIAIAHWAGISLQDANTFSEISFWETTSAAQELAFSPDGQRLAVGELYGRIEIYTLPEGVLQQTLMGDSSGIISLVFSSDGQKVLFANETEQVRLWDLESDKIINSVNCSICDVGFNSSGQPLAWIRGSDTLTIWDVEEGKSLRSLSTTWALASAFNTDWSQLATGGNDGILRIWQPDGNKYKLLNSLNAKGMIWSVAYSPDNRILAAGTNMAEIYLWDVQNGQLLHVLSDGWGDVDALQFSPDSHSLLSSGDDGNLRMWNVGSGNLIQTLESPAIYAKGIFLTNGQLWGTLEGDTETTLLDLSTSKKLQSFQRDLQGAIWRLSISPDGSMIAVQDGYNSIKMVDPVSGKTLHTFDIYPGPLTHLVFSPDGRLLAGLFPADAASANPTGILRVWNLSNWQELYSQEISLAEALAFSLDSNQIALGSSIGKIFIYEAVSGKLLQTLVVHEGVVTSLVFSHDGSILASGGQDGTIRLWDTQTGAEIRLLDRLSIKVRNSSLPVRVGCIAFSPDGNILATGDVDGMIRLWNTATGVQIAAFQGHRGEVDTLDFNLNGTQFVSGGQDGTVRLWMINP